MSQPGTSQRYGDIWRDRVRLVSELHFAQRQNEWLLDSVREALQLAQPGSEVERKLQSILTTFTP